MNFNSMDEILTFAIEKEEKSAFFYKLLAAKAKNDHIKKALIEFANEEMGHKAKLEQIKAGKKINPDKEKIQDLKISEILQEVIITEDIDYQQALTIAMKEEKAAYTLYMKLASLTDNQEQKDIFEMLAREEAKHKLRFELEYDDHIMQEA